MKNIFLEIKFYILFLIIGLIIFTFPMLKTNFDLMPGNGEDICAINAFLEHSWLWLNHIEPDYYFLSPPFNYDNWYSLMLSDNMIGIMPLYWIFRIFLNPFSSMQALVITCCFLNYSTFYYFLRKINYSKIASSVGAFVFAFSIFRYFKMIHPNFYTQFFTIFAMVFFIKINKNNSKIKNNLWFLLSSICLLLQFYTCYTLGFYFCLMLFFSLVLGLLPKTSRDKIIIFFKDFYKYVITYLLFIFVFLIPLYCLNYAAGNYVNPDELIIKITTNSSLFRNVSILDSIFQKNMQYIASPLYTESCCSFGILTTVFAFFAISKLKYAKGLPLTILFFVYITSFNLFALFFTRIFYLIPGGEFIKSPNRILFTVLILISYLICEFINYIEKKEFKKKHFKKIILFIIAGVVVLENIPYNNDPNSKWENYNWSKKEYQNKINELSKEIPKNQNIIKLKYLPANIEKYGEIDKKYIKQKLKKQENIDAMWVALIAHKYTTNCYPLSKKNNEELKKVYELSRVIKNP